jgi:hypothetical protein
MNKDIVFDIEYSGPDTSKFRVIYGGKRIFACNVWNDDITEMKAVCLALQAEILKDASKTTNVVITNATIIAQQ